MKGLEDDKNIEEDWPLKDVVFVEDQKSLPIGIDFFYNNFLIFFSYYYFVFRTCCSCGWFLCCS